MLVENGVKLRALIYFHLKKTGQSQRAYSLSLGLHPDYITGYLCRNPDKWNVPKLASLKKICRSFDARSLEKEMARDMETDTA